MKLKKYFSGSFPRVRTKKKNSKHTDDTKQVDTNKTRMYDSSTLPRRGYVNDAYIDTTYHGYRHSSSPVTFDKNCNSLTLSYSDAYNSNCVFEESDNECYCCKNINNNDLKFDKSVYNVLSWSYSEGESDKNYLSNTVPKSRSRIRTNPWLPSPKLTPTPSSSSKSYSSSPTSSAASSPISDDAPQSSKSRRSTSSDDSAMDIDDVNDRTVINNDCTICDDSNLDESVFLNELDLSENKKFNGKEIMFSDPDSPTVERDSFKHHTDKANYEETLEGLLENETCAVKHDETVLSIQDLLQADDQLFSQDELNKACKKAYDVVPQRCCLYEKDKIDRFGVMEEDEDDINLLEQGGLSHQICCDAHYVSECMNLSTDTGYASLGRNVWKSGNYKQNMEILESEEWDKDSVTAVKSSCVTKGIICSCQLDSDGCEIDDHSQGYDSDIGAECLSPVRAMRNSLHLRDFNNSPSTNTLNGYESDLENDSQSCMCEKDDNVADADDGDDDDSTHSGSTRSLVEIKSSLAEKVFLLRQEKKIVEEKIREAREEDKIRRQQKIKFQKHVASQRKQLLLKTLQDLRHKLENQSLRLQTCYNITLTMQKRIASKDLPSLLA